jgi:hypothetical protein
MTLFPVAGTDVPLQSSGSRAKAAARMGWYFRQLRWYALAIVNSGGECGNEPEEKGAPNESN